VDDYSLSTSIANSTKGKRLSRRGTNWEKAGEKGKTMAPNRQVSGHLVLIMGRGRMKRKGPLKQTLFIGST